MTNILPSGKWHNYTHMQNKIFQKFGEHLLKQEFENSN